MLYVAFKQTYRSIIWIIKYYVSLIEIQKLETDQRVSHAESENVRNIENDRRVITYKN